jgi:AcrR family transcriptional regulator
MSAAGVDTARPDTARPVADNSKKRPATARPTADNSKKPAEPRRPGRPRSEQADQAIIDATLEVFAESGPDGLCIEQVAARAGVGKATIYRRWPGKEDLLVDAIGSLRTKLPQPQGRSVRADLTALVDALSREAADPRLARQFALPQGDGQKYPRLLAKYRATVLEPRRELIRSVLRRGVATGELRESIDVDTVMFLLSGAALARGGPGEPPDSRYGRRIVDELMSGLAAR